MNGNKASYKTLLDAWAPVSVNNDVEIVVGVPAPYLEYVRSTMRKDIETAAQNIYHKDKGAYTGEISCDMIKDVGATWVILGHSERREIFNESSDLVGEKTGYALGQGLKVMACIGEKLDTREGGIESVMAVLSEQLTAIKANVSDWTNLVIAYEPVWAIGTGKTATPEIAQETHAAIREWLKTSVSEDVANSTRILYGGSVKPGNCKELGACTDIDGFLVGGASLQPSFTDVMNATA